MHLTAHLVADIHQHENVKNLTDLAALAITLLERAKAEYLYLDSVAGLKSNQGISSHHGSAESGEPMTISTSQ